uniref:RNA-directed RNA polymerase n=1 Tax=Betachrysovirus sp. TaxID=2809188 RepID=A0AA49K7U8_9VIRU|nr:RNA-dependent RNA polymerase [Betachrysovirus sp.]
MSTFSASYSGTTVHRQATLDYTSGEVEDFEKLAAWDSAIAVVAPVCHGKSTLASHFGGYDADDLVADEGLGREEDPEWEEYCAHLPAPGEQQTQHALQEANRIWFRRLQRFFSICVPDSNAPVVYVHTLEYAHKLRLNVKLVLEIDLGAISESERFADMTTTDAEQYLESIRRQQSANREFAVRHGYSRPRYCPSYTDAYYAAKRVVERDCSEHLRPNFYTEHISPQLASADPVVSLINKCTTVLSTNAFGKYEKAIAARAMSNLYQEAALDVTHQHHNHARWASEIHRVATPAYYANLKTFLTNREPIKADEETIRAAFPIAAGTPKFAVVHVSDWLKRDTTEYNGLAWSTQLLTTQRHGNASACSYERLLSTMMYDKILEDNPKYAKMRDASRRLKLGLLPASEFAKRSSACHNLIRISGTVFGEVMPESQIGLLTYWSSLAGRSQEEVDIEKEAAERAVMSAPKRYYSKALGRWSGEEFDARLHRAIVHGFSETTTEISDKIYDIAEWATDFDEFLKHRKQWVKSGSATGAPKTDLYLAVPAEYRNMVSEVAESVAEGVSLTLHRVRRLRLNKSATFEFPEFVQIVKDALRDYKPNSFTRYFTKKEVGRAKPRSLYPSTLMHYIVCCFVLTLVEKGSPAKGTRQQARSDQQRKDHWLWVETYDRVTALMMDYVSFNEQHENKHLKDLINSLKGWYSQFGLLTTDMKWAIDWVQESFDNIVLEVGDKHYQFMNGLLSGWRMTSFGNSWLNKAYMAVIKEQVLELSGRVVLEHAQSGGDDVMALETSLSNAHITLNIGQAMGFSFKAIKQLISNKYREFFRLFATGSGVYGSVCRIIGSAASGQWSNSVVGTLVEPSVKFASVIDVMAKIMRRSDFPLAFGECMTACMYDKWARIEDKRMTVAVLHGTVASGGRGIPTADGTMYELGGMKIMAPRQSVVKLHGVPHDASDVAVETMRQAARSYVDESELLPAGTVAVGMANKVFHSALAQAQGIGVAQLAVPSDVEYYQQQPSITKVLTQGPVNDRRYRFWDKFRELDNKLSSAKRAEAKLSSIEQVLSTAGYNKALDSIALECGVEAARLRNKMDWTLYGYARVALTEDYYDDVVWLATLCADDESNMNYIAAAFATDLSNMMRY